MYLLKIDIGADSLANWSSNNWSNSPSTTSDGLGPPNTIQKAVFNNNHPEDI